jgi:hypothetical protein
MIDVGIKSTKIGNEVANRKLRAATTCQKSGTSFSLRSSMERGAVAFFRDANVRTAAHCGLRRAVLDPIADISRTVNDLWAPRKIAPGANRGHASGERQGIGRGTKRNHS